MSDHLVRVGHLRAIQKARGWTDAELARQLGRKQTQVRTWFMTPSEEGSRQIGEKLARSLEEKLGLARYALDDRGSTPETRGGAVALLPTQTQGAAVTRRARELPVIPWAGIEEMLELDNAVLRQERPHLESFAVAGPRAKFIEMPDDSMMPDVQPGDHLLFDPGLAPRAGDFVLVKVSSGEYFVRVFRPRTAYVFEAAALNPAFVSLSSREDVATVLGVMVEHRRYRRP